MDLIAGLDGETFDDFKYSIDKAISLSPDNITVHTLCIKKGSKLAETENRLAGQEVEKMVDYANTTLIEAGYNPYYLYRQKYMAGNLENVGYSKKGKECVYNVNVMEEISSTVACGANAISKRVFDGGERIERQASPKDVPTYLSKLDKIKEEKSKLFS
jgi:oxygen-independent coproporphyrinogen-3 oxidase